MKQPPLDRRLEEGRFRSGDYGSREEALHGAFNIPGPCGERLIILSSGRDSDTGWEHVSVSIDRRVPNWQEMCFVKDLFWGGDEAVMQLHPPKRDYVNCHPHCLHLWRPIRAEIPLPDSMLVGPKQEIPFRKPAGR